jgi:hypothetical protein
MATGTPTQTTTTTTSTDSSGNAATTQTTQQTTPSPSSRPSTTVEIITAVAKKLGVDPNLAIAIAYVESGLNPNEPSGDPGNGPEGDLYQLNANGGEGSGLTEAQIANPTVNATTALTEVAGVQKAYPGASPGAIAVLAQRPRGYVVGMTPEQADATAYGQEIDGLVAQLNAGTAPAALTTAGNTVPAASGSSPPATTDTTTGAVLTSYIPTGAGAWLYTLDTAMNPTLSQSSDWLSNLFGIFDVSADIRSEETTANALFVKLACAVGFTGIAAIGIYMVAPSISSRLAKGVLGGAVGGGATGTAEKVAQIATARAAATEATKTQRANERAAFSLAKEEKLIAAKNASAEQRHRQAVELAKTKAEGQLKVTAAVGRRSKARTEEEKAVAERHRQSRLATNARARARRPASKP